MSRDEWISTLSDLAHQAGLDEDRLIEQAMLFLLRTSNFPDARRRGLSLLFHDLGEVVIVPPADSPP